MKDDDIVLSDRYHLGDLLGQGGMGTVYRAHDTILKRDVAVKLVSGAGLGTDGRARLLREAQAAAGLNHPNIITVFDTGEADLGRQGGRTPFVVMELVEGRNLHEKPPQDLEQTLTIARELCAALEHAHNHDIIHRDLKPENVLMAEDGTAKLVDFGLARAVSSRLTSEGEIAGTLDYMAPELALGKAFDRRADLYSLGVMLYELTTGRLPFVADDPVSIITQHLYAPVVQPWVHNNEIPSLLDALIVKLMAKEPDQRPDSAAAVLTALERVDLEAEFAVAEELSLLDRIVRGRFVGRENELAEAKAIWNRLTLGEGQTLLISGEPGIGKTRLIRELATLAEVTGGTALIGACYPEGGAPYAPISQIVRRGLQNGGKEAADLPEYVLADLLKLTPDLQAQYRDVPPNPPLEPEDEQRRLFENMVTFCKVLSEQRPLLVILEDAHWADSGTLALLRHLARRLRQQVVMLVATYREEELDDALPFNQLLQDLNRERLATRIKLSRFSEQETETMLAALFTTEITPVFLDSVYRETEGNPFFIEEICKSLVESGQIVHEGGTWHRRQTDELEIPQSIRIAIQSRVSKFPDEYQETFNLAAIMGREFDFDTLVKASDQNEDILIDALEAAEGAQIIEEVSSKNGVSFSFAHALIPTTLTEGVRTLRRRQLHQRAAQAIETLHPEAYEELAYHNEEAGNKDGARSYYTRAGERAADAYANQEAETYFRAALDLEPAPDERADLLASLAGVTGLVGRVEEAIVIWKEAADLYIEQGNKDKIALCYTRMASERSWLGDTSAAIDLGKEGLALTADAPESADLAGLLHETARCFWRNDDLQQAERLCQQSLEMARRVSAKRVEVDALITLASLPGVKSEVAIAALKKAIAISQAEKLPRQEARAHNNLASIVGIGCRDHFLKAAEIRQKMGDLSGELFALTNAAGATMRMGELSRVEGMVTRLDDLLDQLVDPGYSEEHYQHLLAYYEYVKGNFEGSAVRWRVLLQRARDAGSHSEIAFCALALGEVHMELGALDEAKAVLEQGVRAADESQVFPVQIRASLATIAARKGDTERGRQLYNRAKQILEDPPKLWVAIELSRANAELLAAEQRWVETFAAFQETDELFASVEGGLYRTIYLQEWAQAYLDRGQPEDIVRARELYGEALAEFEDMGSPGYSVRIQARLDELDG